MNNIPVIELKDYYDSMSEYSTPLTPPYIIWWDKTTESQHPLFKGEMITEDCPNGEIVAISNVSVEDLVGKLMKIE